jgi:hypothetical protein
VIRGRSTTASIFTKVHIIHEEFRRHNVCCICRLPNRNACYSDLPTPTLHLGSCLTSQVRPHDSDMKKVPTLFYLV